jgi:hypothetical protein
MKFSYYYGLNNRPVVKSEGLSISELVSLSKNDIIAEHAIGTEHFFSIFKEGELVFHKRNISLFDFFDKLKEFKD